jgi:hypothetical protein
MSISVGMVDELSLSLSKAQLRRVTPANGAGSLRILYSHESYPELYPGHYALVLFGTRLFVKALEDVIAASNAACPSRPPRIMRVGVHARARLCCKSRATWFFM